MNSSWDEPGIRSTPQEQHFQVRERELLLQVETFKRRLAEAQSTNDVLVQRVHHAELYAHHLSELLAQACANRDNAREELDALQASIDATKK